MKIAFIHDHLAQDGGAERVLQAFLEIWPQAPTYVVVHNKKTAHPIFQKYDIRTSFLQRWPGGVKHYQWFFPLMPTAVESYDLSEYDVILSSTASFAKGVITRPETLHISYCHTPTRYLWSDTHSYVQELGSGRTIKWMLPFFLTQVRQWDRLAAERVDRFIANSHMVQQRIAKYYKATSEVIYPPVDVKRFTVGQPQDYYLAGGRLVPYKRFDLIIQAFNRLGRKLIIFGDGPDFKQLQAQAHSNIQFVGKVTDKEIVKLYQGALAFINPQIEDFGITMIEAMACGRPVFAYGQGGAKEIIIPGKTGDFFDYQTWEDLADLIVHQDPLRYDPQAIRIQAERFSLERFKVEIKQAVDNALAHFTPNH